MKHPHTPDLPRRLFSTRDCTVLQSRLDASATLQADAFKPRCFRFDVWQRATTAYQWVTRKVPYGNLDDALSLFVARFGYATQAGVLMHDGFPFGWLKFGNVADEPTFCIRVRCDSPEQAGALLQAEQWAMTRDARDRFDYMGKTLRLAKAHLDA